MQPFLTRAASLSPFGCQDQACVSSCDQHQDCGLAYHTKTAANRISLDVDTLPYGCANELCVTSCDVFRDCGQARSATLTADTYTSSAPSPPDIAQVATPSRPRDLSISKSAQNHVLSSQITGQAKLGGRFSPPLMLVQRAAADVSGSSSSTNEQCTTTTSVSQSLYPCSTESATCYPIQVKTITVSGTTTTTRFCTQSSTVPGKVDYCTSSITVTNTVGFFL